MVSLGRSSSGPNAGLGSSYSVRKVQALGKEDVFLPKGQRRASLICSARASSGG